MTLTLSSQPPSLSYCIKLAAHCGGGGGGGYYFQVLSGRRDRYRDIPPVGLSSTVDQVAVQV